MSEDYDDIADEAERNSHREPLEEQLLRLGEVHTRILRRVFDGLGVFGERLPARPEGGGRRSGVVIIITGSGDAADGEGDEVDEEHDQRVGDLQAREEQLDCAIHVGDLDCAIHVGDGGALVHCGASKIPPTR